MIGYICRPHSVSPPYQLQFQESFPKYEQIIASLKINYGVCLCNFRVTSFCLGGRGGGMRQGTKIHWRYENDAQESW